MFVYEQGQGTFEKCDIFASRLSGVEIREQRDPTVTRVADVMTVEVACCTPETTIDEARGAMKNRRIRHLPVVEGGRLCGLVSIGDLNAHEAFSQEQTIYLLQEYLYGRV